MLPPWHESVYDKENEDMMRHSKQFANFRLDNTTELNFIDEPCIDTIIINSNQLMHISVFIKNTLKVYLKVLLPRHVSDHIGIHPQGAIIRS